MKGRISIFVIALLIGVFYSVIVLRLNIHGDSGFHTQFAKESAESGTLVKEQPHRIYSSENGKRTYMPITYPLTSEALFGIIYEFSGETGLKLYAPLSAMLIFLLVYLLLQGLGHIPALVGATVAVLSIGERLFMTPLIEPFIVIAALGGLLGLKHFFKESDLGSLFLSAVFFGVCVTIKQQGLLILVAVFCTVIPIIIYKSIKERLGTKRLASLVFIFLMTCLLIPSVAVGEQIKRTGTFAFSPGKTELPTSLPFYSKIQPLFTSRYPANPEALAALNDQIAYGKERSTIFTKLRGFLLSPFMFYRSVDQKLISPGIEMFYLLTLLLLLISCIRLVKKTDTFWLVILLLSLFEVVFSFALKTPITQYHVFGVVLVVFVLTKLTTELVSRFGFAGICYLLFASVFFMSGYHTYMQPLWRSNGRETDRNIEAYQRVARYVEQNTPVDSIFMAPEMRFRYYAKRDTVWLNEDNAHIMRRVITASKAESILPDLKLLSVSYIVINKEQTERYGVFDYMPPGGLASSITKSKHFTKIYDAFDDGQIVLYRVDQ